MLTSHQMQPNQGLPEIIRVRAIRGFRGPIDGRHDIANPGDVVEVPRILAMEMRAAGRAIMTSDEKVRNPNYMPERKRNARAGADTVQTQIGALTKALEGLQRVVETLAARPRGG